MSSPVIARVARFAVLLLLFGGLGSPLRGQEVEAICEIGPALIERAKAEAPKAAEAAMQSDQMAALVQSPETTAHTKQLAAPSNTSGSTSLVNGAAFTELFNLALENAVTEGQDGALTLSLNLFGIQAAMDPAVRDRQSLYGSKRNTLLRRFNGALTLGGKGDKIDQDGDGEVDEALTAENLGDIWNLEIKYRILGSRDRRDWNNFTRFNRAVDEEFDQSTQDFALLATEVIEILNASPRRNEAIHATQTGCFREDVFWEIVEADPDFAARLSEFADSEQKLKDAIPPQLQRIDESFVLTAVAGFNEREEKFGPDSWMIGLRGAWRELTFNLERTETDGMMGAPNPTNLKLGIEGAIQLMKASRDSRDEKEPMRLSLSGSYENFDDVPMAKHSTNAKFNVKFEFPLSRVYPVMKAVKLPISITWANHADLLTDEDEVRGHIGFSFDTSALKKLILGNGDES